jgi:hypothetical protein
MKRPLVEATFTARETYLGTRQGILVMLIDVTA